MISPDRSKLHRKQFIVTKMAWSSPTHLADAITRRKAVLIDRLKILTFHSLELWGT